MTTYAESGVDTTKNLRLVHEIKQFTKIDTEQFSGVYPIPNMPQLVMGSDGVGTKIKLSQTYSGLAKPVLGLDFQAFDGIGQDLVAMCANDVIASGGRPQFFQDYIAMNSLDEDTVTDIIRQINDACASHGIQLTGGEMAELPNTYINDKIPELVGFCVGTTVNPIDVNDVKEGDTIIGLPSSGPHANGYSLINDIVKLKTCNIWSNGNAAAFLEPTTIYSNVTCLYEQRPSSIHSMAHITGGGLFENLIRAVPEGRRINVDYNSWEIPNIFKVIEEAGNVPEEDMWATFNMGVGFCIITDKPGNMLNELPGSWILGKIT